MIFKKIKNFMDFPVYIQGFQKISKSFHLQRPETSNLLEGYGSCNKKIGLDQSRICAVDKFQILRAI